MSTKLSFARWISFFSFLVIQVLVLLTEVGAQNRSCPIGSFFNGRRCRRCRPGTYQDKVGSTSCEKCPSSTFTAVRGVISRELCLMCPDDSTSLPGARKCFKCPPGETRFCGVCQRCPRGSYFNGCDCEKCYDGSITTEDNQADCIECPPGMRSNKARTRCIPGNCPPGYQFYFGECVACNSVEFGYFAFKNETTGLCQDCPPRTTILDFQAPAIKCEKCPPGQFLTDILVTTEAQLTVCEKCPPGTTTVGFGKPLCRDIGKPCPDNTFEDEDGDCQVCDPGFRLDRKNKRCVECKPDEVLGKYVHIFTKCRKCAPGQTRQFSLCACPEGEVLRNGRCRKCPAGTYASGRECLPCRDTAFSRAGATLCTLCPEGTTSAGTNGRRCERIRCGKGLIVPPRFLSIFPVGTCISPVTGCPKGLRGLGYKRGRFLCANKKGKVVCPKGYVFDGREDCISCSPGWRIVKTASGRLMCRECPRSKPLSIGNTTRTCRRCKDDSLPNARHTKCICRRGNFIAKDGRCTRCPSLPFPQLPFDCILVRKRPPH